MNSKRGNSLIVILNGALCTYRLDTKDLWTVGRPTVSNSPDIRLKLPTVSREHGELRCMGGVWFYIEKSKKNGTIYNDKHVGLGIGGRVKPIMLSDKDVFIFGGGNEKVISAKTAWALYLERDITDRWQVIDTKGFDLLTFDDGDSVTTLSKPEKGLVIEKENGIAIYMGELTYTVGEMQVIGE